VKLIIERVRELNLKTHLAFLEYEKAFDKDKSHNIFNILQDKIYQMIYYLL